MMKNPATNVVINRDDSYYESIKLRREQKKKEKILSSQISNLNSELDNLKQLLYATIDGMKND